MYLDTSEAGQLIFQNKTPHPIRQNDWHSIQYVGDLFSILFMVAGKFSILYKFMSVPKGVSTWQT